RHISISEAKSTVLLCIADLASLDPREGHDMIIVLDGIPGEIRIRLMGVAGLRRQSPPTAFVMGGRDAFVLNSQFAASHGGLIILPVTSSFGQTTMRSPSACHCTNSKFTKPGPFFTSCVSSNCTRPRTPT